MTIFVIVVAGIIWWLTGFAAGLTYRHHKASGSTPSASHNRQITKPAACEKCDYDYASIVCSTCGPWIINKRRQAS